MISHSHGKKKKSFDQTAIKSVVIIPCNEIIFGNFNRLDVPSQLECAVDQQ